MNRYDISPGQIDVFLNGTLDPATLSKLFATIASDRRFHCQLKQFWHLQDVDCSNFHSSCLPDLGHALKEEPGCPYPQVAFVAKTDLLFGLCRAYAAWLGSKPIEVGVFRSYSDALAWVYPASEPVSSTDKSERSSG